MYNQKKHHQDRIVARRMKYMSYVFIYSPFVKPEVIEKDTKRARKTKPWDCGRSGCKYCSNPRRAWGLTTIKEQIAKVRTDEMLKEYYDDVA